MTMDTYIKTKDTSVKKIPYGICDFERIRTQDYWYADKTMYIPVLENSASFLSLLRPRRFGKSLFLSMLECYYDINQKEKFATLFGDLWIGSHPTENANRFQILRLDFSKAHGSGTDIKDSFYAYLAVSLDSFMDKYKDVYPKSFVENFMSEPNVASKLLMLDNKARQSGYPLYLIIDEYDNFTNVVLANEGHEAFHAITHTNGFYRETFKIFKGMFERVLLMGVSPITLDDLTSGYNIDTNVSQDPELNSILGFSESEVRSMISYYHDKKVVNRPVEEIIKEIRPWYDGYCFSLKQYGKESVYNCDMVLYYLSAWQRSGNAPVEMVDKNIRTDFSKLNMLMRLDHTHPEQEREDFLQQISATGYVNMTLRTSFSAVEVMERDKFLSLVYYMGMLTIGGEYWDEYHMIIPNLCVQEQYWSFMRHKFNRIHKLTDGDVKETIREMARGEWHPFVRMISQAIHKMWSVRSSIKGEYLIQGYFEAYLSQDNNLFIVKPEREMNGGYCDILVLPNRARFPQVKDGYILELKYLNPATPDNAICESAEKGRTQLRKYSNDDIFKGILPDTAIHRVLLLFRGPDLLIAEEL